MAEHQRWRSFVVYLGSWDIVQVFGNVRTPPTHKGFSQLVDLQIYNVIFTNLDFFVDQVPRLTNLRLPLSDGRDSGHALAFK